MEAHRLASLQPLFSPPESPGTKDVAQIGGLLDQTLPVTTKIKNARGVVVGTIPPTAFNYAYGDISDRATWNGRDNLDLPVSDGLYTFEFLTNVGVLWVLGNLHRDHTGQFDHPTGVAIGKDGRIHVLVWTSKGKKNLPLPLGRGLK